MRVLHRAPILSVALLFVVGGGLYLGLPSVQAVWQRHQGRSQNKLMLQATTSQTVAVKSFALADPVQLQLPRLSITVPIKQGLYNKTAQSWSLDKTSAFIMQPWIDQSGIQLPQTPVLYGHDIPAVFMHLNGVAPDELLTITQQDGTRYSFRYVDDVVVNPHDNSVFQVRYTDSVLLMTCTGAHFEHRRVLRFELVSQGQKQQSVSNKEGSHEPII